MAALLLTTALLPLPLAGRRPSGHIRRSSRFHDWTTHHAVYPQNGTLGALHAAESDPRAIFRWRDAEREQSRGFFGFRRHPKPRGIVVDNSSASNQASSIYFATQNTNNAVKLTQATFQ
jgi:hypothetical protein